MICPGSEDGNTPEFLAMKFPLVSSSESLVPSVPPGVSLTANNAVFLTPVNFKPDGGAIITPTSKPFVLQPSTSRDSIKKDSISPNDAASITQIKDGSPIMSSKHISPSDIIPSFQSGELTVSVKNAKCDFDFAPTDFSKLPNSLAGDSGAINKTRTSTNSDFPLADITQQITKFSDLTKLANFSTADLAKLSSFSIADFTRTSSPSPSTYMRHIANLFGPLGKISPAKDMDNNEQRKSSDFVTVDAVSSPFKSAVSSSETSLRNFSSAEDYINDRKKLDTQIDSTKIGRSSEYQGTEDLTISSIKPDFGGMLDMTTLHKKQQSSQSADMGDSLNLSKDR
jgi:hypothetical protein